MKEIKTVSIVGMGALGILYGSHLVEKMGHEAVTFLMDGERYVRNQGKAVFCNGRELHFSCIPAEDAKPVDLLIVAVKSTGLDSAIDVMKNAIGENTIIISVLNGISSEEIIAARYGKEHLVYTVALGMDAMKFENKLTYTKMGLLAIGEKEPCQKDNTDAVQAFFEKIEMPYRRESDITHAMWSKFMLNVGINQTCMVFSCTYGDTWKEGKERDTMLGAMREVIAIANAEGIRLTETDLQEYDDLIHTLLPEGMPSMRQDRVAGRPSEVEMFAGTVIALGKKNHIETPVNNWLYEKVKEIEASYS